jgi:Super-infection exclusion protein B
VTIESFLVLLRPFFGASGLVLAFAGGVVLLLPSAWLDMLGLLSTRDTHRSEFGLSLLVGVGILIAVQFFDKQSIAQRALQRWRDRRTLDATVDAQREMLHKLTADEKAYLAPYIKKNKAMQRFNLEDGIAGSLRVRGIIFCGAQVFDQVTGAEFALAPWARDYLIAHPELLNGASKIDARARFRVI